MPEQTPKEMCTLLEGWFFGYKSEHSTKEHMNKLPKLNTSSRKRLFPFLLAALLCPAVYAQTGPGYALALNGTNQYVSVPSSVPLSLGNQFTIELWFFQTSTL